MLDHRFQMTVLPRHLAPFRDQLRQLFVIPNMWGAMALMAGDDRVRPWRQLSQGVFLLTSCLVALMILRGRYGF
jgi:hypothetical protein